MTSPVTLSNFGFLQSEWPQIFADAQKAETQVIPTRVPHVFMPDGRWNQQLRGSTRATPR